jgi:hypothetical protein
VASTVAVTLLSAYNRDMDKAPDYAQGHLVVAAVRILEHRHGKPPTMEEIGELLAVSHEVVGAVARALRDHGIVKILETPFDTRVEVTDHAKLEELHREARTAAMKGEVDAFLERTRSKHEKVEDLFKSGKYQEEKKKKFAGLEEQLKDFHKKKVRDPFARDEASGEAEDGESDEGAEEATAEDQGADKD